MKSKCYFETVNDTKYSFCIEYSNEKDYLSIINSLIILNKLTLVFTRTELFKVDFKGMAFTYDPKVKSEDIANYIKFLDTKPKPDLTLKIGYKTKQNTIRWNSFPIQLNYVRLL
ncbi:MAG: hypothetical protein M0D57_08895 [Sphingobacteriales bacterium JAD_PAG50586_3]|nr:MAG: hypothetical protein M0D57_08895 [Sphingobacteriales bacterium JAD_PAG50586_3]